MCVGVSLRLCAGCAKLACHPEPKGACPEERHATKGGIAIVPVEFSVTSVCLRRSGIQNGGVIRMSGMSSMLFIALYRDGLTHYEPK